MDYLVNSAAAFLKPEMWWECPKFKNEWHVKRLRLYGAACTRMCSLSEKRTHQASCRWNCKQKNKVQPLQWTKLLIYAHPPCELMFDQNIIQTVL